MHVFIKDHPHIMDECTLHSYSAKPVGGMVDHLCTDMSERFSQKQIEAWSGGARNSSLNFHDV